MIQIDKIYNEDCLEGMKRIDDASIDCIITDLPYGVLNEQSEGGSWDSIIPFEPLWEQYNRIIKDNGAILLFSQGMFTAKLMMSNEKMWRYNLIWDKSIKTGFLNARRMPLRQHEDICVFYRKLPTYNPQMTKWKKHWRHPKSKKDKECNRCYGDFPTKEPTVSEEIFPSSIINFSNANQGEKVHPTQKPVALLQYLIRTYTNSGGGSFGLLHRLGHHLRRRHPRETPLPRLRAQQGVFRHRREAYLGRAAAADAVVRAESRQARLIGLCRATRKKADRPTDTRF